MLLCSAPCASSEGPQLKAAVLRNWHAHTLTLYAPRFTPENMQKRAWLGLLVGCGVALSAILGVRMKRSEDARELTARAQRLLHPPVTETVSLRDVRAREARELLESAQELIHDAARAELLLEARATELYARGEHARAKLVLADARAQTPELLQLRAAVLLAQGDTTTALATLDRLPAALQTDPRSLLLRSDVARALGRGDVALAAAQRCIDTLTGAPLANDAASAAMRDNGPSATPQRGDKAKSGAAACYERRGLAHELLGHVAQARTDLERAAQLDRRSSSALLALGRVQRQSGAMAEAVIAFHEASQRNPEEAEAWLGSGVCRAALGDGSSARVDLERAQTLAPKRAEPLIALADLDVAERNLESALRRYRAALLLDPQSATAHVKLGNTLMRAGAVPEAIPQYRAAIAQRPDMAAAHNGLGAAFFAQGELALAEDELKSAAKLDPKDAHPWLNLARVYERRGDDGNQQAALEHARNRQ